MSLNRSALVVFALGAVATAARGQAAPCTIDEGKPAQVKDARNDLVKAEIMGAKPEEQKKLLTNVVRRMTTAPETITNVPGRNLMLGRALVKLATMPGINPDAASRAALGYATSPEGTVDMLAAADSAFRAIEQAMPNCVSEVEPYRRTLYIPVIQKAVNFYNAKALDSAAYYSNRSLVIYPSSPIAYNVLANIAQSKDDYAGAAAAYRKMVVAIGTDTAFADEKKAAMLNIA